jgi:histone H3/H4
LIISDEEDNDNDDFSAAPTRKAPPPTTTHEPPAKRQKTAPPARLPSLSPLSSALQPAPAPPPQNPASAIGSKKDDIPLLPSALITRLLHESFEDKSIKIGKDANALTARYLDLFVREAVARATEVAKERKEMRQAGGQNVDDGLWLDVHDLEEVAPGLVLDF